MFGKRVISRSVSFFFIISLLLLQVRAAYATGSGDIVGTINMPIQAADPYQAPNYLKASPADDWIHARGWSEGAILELTIRNAGETDSYNTTAVVAQSPWNPNELDDKVAIFDLAGNWNVQVGDVATVTDGTEEEILTVADITQIHWLSGGYQTDGPAVTASQDAAHSYNLAHPEIELLYIVGWPGDNADYPADIFGPQGILNSNFLKGEWLDLDPLITSSGYDTSQFAPQLMDLFYNDDEGQYGLPFAAFPNMLYYQKGMFDLEGLNYPPANYGDLYVLDGEAVEWNIDTMYEVAKRLTLDGSGKNATEAGFNPNTIIQYGYVPQWQAATGIASLWGAGSIVGGTPGAYTASIPSQWTLAWKAYYSGLWGQEVFIPNGPAISNPEFGEGNSFNSGKIAMATAQAWYLCCIADAGANWEIGVPPSYQGTVNGVFHSDSFRIHKNSLHQQEAFDALVYLLDNASLIEAFDQMPARTSAQATFLAEKETQYPFVDNWHLLQDGLSYIENPSNESWMPNLEIAWERLSQFQDRLLNYSDLNIDNEIVILQWGLEHIFNTGINPGWPHFVVRANEDRVEGWEWPDGATVTIEIKRGGIVQTTETAEVGPAPWNPNEIRFEYNFSGEFDILAGDVVTVTDGTLTKSVTVSIHSITEINVDDDIVYGVSDPGIRIDVWACDNSSCDYNRHAISDPTTGEWQVDFSIAGDEEHEQNLLNLAPGVWVDSSQNDGDGDSTNFGVGIPNPIFSARLTENEVHGYQWPLGAEITLTIDDPNTPQPIDYTKVLTVGLADWNPNETFVQFRLWEDEFTLAGGMTVTMSDGTTQKTHLVTSLTVTDVSPANDTISGTAQAGSQIDVGHIYCDENGCYGFRRAIADTDGTWLVDFSQPGAEQDEQDIIDIVPGMGNEARQCDEDGDCTQYGWNAPNPHFGVRANDNRVEGWEWPNGATVTIEIERNGQVEIVRTAVVQPAEWNPNEIRFDYNFNGEFDIQENDVVRVTHDETSKATTVSRHSIFGVNTDIVYGVSEPDIRVDVWFCNDNGCYNRHAIPDSNGEWQVDFSQPGSEPNEQAVTNITPGSWVDSEQRDDDGDKTMFGINTPNPRVEAWLDDNVVFAIDWPMGEELTLEIDDPDTVSDPDYTATEMVTEASNWDPNVSLLIFNFDGEFNLQPGMNVQVSGAFTEKELAVDNLVVSEANAQTNTVSGTNSPDRQMWIMVVDQDECCRNFASNGDGSWSVNLSTPGSNGESPIDLIPGSRGYVYSTDNDGDESVARWEVLVPIGKTAPIDSTTDVSLSPTLEWTTQAGATSYEYCYSSAPGPCIKWNSVGTATSVTLSGLAPNYTYYWQVRAVSENGTIEANDGTWWSFTTTTDAICTWPAYTPPISATFNDVPMTVGHWNWVERLANSTVTAGCGNGNFCPLTEVNRAQMAIFLLRSKHCGSSYAPPAVGDSTGFGDVPLTASYAAWVKQLAAEGITAGCGNGNFCPQTIVNRAQMAIFLLRAKHGATYSPPAVGASTGFGDVSLDASFAPWVKQLAAEGVTSGCGNGNFCPLTNVNRAQMATFLVRAFGLP